MKHTLRTVLSLVFSSAMVWLFGIGSAAAFTAPSTPARQPVLLLAQTEGGATEAPMEEEHKTQEMNEEQHKGMEEEKQGIEEQHRGMEEERRGAEEEQKGAEEERRGMEEQEKGLQEEEKGMEEEEGAD